MDNTLISMASNDTNLIRQLKATVQYQQSVMVKREKLVFAITNNVMYLSELHKKNNARYKLLLEELN